MVHTTDISRDSKHAKEGKDDIGEDWRIKRVCRILSFFCDIN